MRAQLCEFKKKAEQKLGHSPTGRYEEDERLSNHRLHLNEISNDVESIKGINAAVAALPLCAQRIA